MWHQVIGHEKIVESLRNTLRSGHLAGAYLFAGPEHVGKEFTAMVFARAICCTESVDDACGRCVACRKVEDGNHPDVRHIHPDGSWMKIAQIRRMQRELTYRSMEASHKICILTDADRMTTQAANSLLKTLEEPPGDAVLVLVTSRYDALLPTIRSRCRTLKFNHVSVNDLAQALMQRAMLPEGLARQFATLSSGHVARALGMGEWKEQVGDPVPPPAMEGLDPIPICREAEVLQKRPEQLDVLLTWYRDLLMVKQQVPDEALTYPSTRKSLERLSESYATWQIQQAIQWIQETKQYLQRNINAALALEVLLIRLANLNARSR